MKIAIVHDWLVTYAGAEKVRTLKPNQPITMEYLGERLNIEVDENNLVSGVRCG